MVAKPVVGGKTPSTGHQAPRPKMVIPAETPRAPHSQLDCVYSGLDWPAERVFERVAETRVKGLRSTIPAWTSWITYSAPKTSPPTSTSP